MHYILQALDRLEPLAFALGALISIWAFRRCRKVGYLVLAIYFSVAVFSVLVLPRIKATLRTRQITTLSQVQQHNMDAAVSESVDRMTREGGVQTSARERDIRLPLGPIILVLGVWLLARRENRFESTSLHSERAADEHRTT